MKIISACLGGINCKYNGGNNYQQVFKDMTDKGDCRLICPETTGGLPVPRLACEIKGGTGLDVIAGYARVIDQLSRDLTDYFLAGAYQTLLVAKNAGADTAILKSRSPSCGVGKIYDGTFSGKLIAGDGVTTALLKLHGLKVINSDEYDYKE